MTVYRWREHRDLPVHRVGRLWKFKLSEVDYWVRAEGAEDEHINASGAVAQTNQGSRARAKH
ncbi:MAG: helix-turn-helix domain-containing protein [Betaproteobacteria bacterium]|jgi:hypothetical protein